MYLKIFAITDGGSNHYQDVRKAASLCSRYMVEMKGKKLKGICGGGAVYYVHGKGQGLGDGGQLVIEDAS